MTNAWRRFATFYLLGVIANMCASFQAPLVMPLGKAFGVEPKVVGLVMSAQFIAYLFGGSAVGKLVALMGVRRAAQLGLIVIALTSIANWHAASLVLFVLSNLVQGLGMLTTVVAAQIGAAAMSTDESRARVLATWATAPLIGLALGLLLSSQFADEVAWRSAFLALAGTAAVLLLPTFVLPSGSLPSAAGGRKGAGVMAETAAFRVSLAVACSVTAINGSVSSWPTYLSQVHNTTPGRVGGLSSVAMLAGVLGSLGVGMALSRGWSLRQLLTLIVPIAVASATIVFGAFTGFTPVIAGMFFWHLAAGAMTGLLFATLPGVLHNPDNLPVATGLLYQFAAAGTMLGAPLYLWLAGLAYASSALTVLTCAALIAMALAVPIPQGGAQRQSLPLP